MFKKVRTIYLDYDGTIHNSLKIYAPAFRKAYGFLVEKKVAQARVWEDREIAKWLGYNSHDMWQAFMPSLDSMIKNEASAMIGSEMSRLIKEGHSVLYEGAIETLSYLKGKGYKLIFLSNCSENYRDMARTHHDLDKYFDGMFCSETYGYRPKQEILSIIKNRFPEDGIMIGDRYQDIEAGLKNQMKTIGCIYGYPIGNELLEADLLIEDIKELMTIF